MMKRLASIFVLGLSGTAFAQAINQDAHPALSVDSSWAGIMLIVILGLFLMAAVIGPIVRALEPREVPPAHSHDEPPGTSGHHGKSGQVDQNAPEHEHGH